MNGQIDKSGLAGEKAKLQHALENSRARPPSMSAVETTGKVVGITPGIGKIEILLPGDIPAWADLGHTVNVAVNSHAGAGHDGAWFKLFSRVALALGCLPSGFMDGNEHVIATAVAMAKPKASVHPDELAVDRFAVAMKAKMAKQRAKGYDGWDDVVGLPTERLQGMLVDHIGKGDPVDVGNFAMMLWNRNEQTAAAVAQPLAAQDIRAVTEDAERYRWMRSKNNLKACDLVNMLWDENLDAAVDAARAAANGAA